MFGAAEAGGAEHAGDVAGGGRLGAEPAMNVVVAHTLAAAAEVAAAAAAERSAEQQHHQER